MRAGEPFQDKRVLEQDLHNETNPEKVSALTLVGGAVTTAAALVQPASVAGVGGAHGLPLAEALQALVPHGALPRGTTVAIHGAGATSFALGMVSAAAQQGAFVAVVAPRTFGLGACVDFGVPLRRVVQFDVAGMSQSAKAWPQVVAALIDGFDIVLLADRHRLGDRHARQLVARNRERGSLIVRVGGPAWHQAPDFRFDVSSPTWAGLGKGHGHLQSRQVTVQVAGRRHKGAPRSHELLLPASRGGVAAVPPTALSEAAPAYEPAARFAGSDIDAMLDAVDKHDSDDGAVSDGQGSGGQGSDQASTSGAA